ncbi:hypothetical protein LCGC14_3125230, partial [marine sediment metagenome]
MGCIEEIAAYIEDIDIEEMDCDTSCQIDKQILTDEFDDPEFLAFVHNCLRDVNAVIVKE